MSNEIVAILEDAISFIEGLSVVPLLMSDDIEMRLTDVQDHARIEAASLRKRMADRANRPSLTEDEREQFRRETTVLRGQIAYLKPRTLRNPTWHINHDRGYVIVDAERSEGHAPGVPGSLYYRLVNDRKEVIDLLATMFEIRALADRSEPRQEKEGTA